MGPRTCTFGYPWANMVKRVGGRIQSLAFRTPNSGASCRRFDSTEHDLGCYRTSEIRKASALASYEPHSVLRQVGSGVSSV